MKPEKPTLREFMACYERLSSEQQARFPYLLAGHVGRAFIKNPSPQLLRALWDIFTGLIWPDLSPVVKPALVLILAILIYAAIGGHVHYTAGLVQLLAGAGCLAGAMAGRLAGEG